MKKTIVLCILTALLFTGCARMPVQPEPAAPEVVDPTVTGTTNETMPAAETASAAQPGGGITEEEAKDIAISHAGLTQDQVTFVKSHLDPEDGRKVYDVEFYTQDFKEYDYEINAETGEIVEFDSDAEFYAPPADSGAVGGITEDSAKALALERVPGATLSDIREFKADHDDGRLEYEGTIVFDKTEYEFEIDAATGEFLSWEAESVFD
ncbi:MAG: hypothetical protein E7464_00275 [Ruminococcaceae bacterium]|nr:hypothetical protein [Oscillospiraceae bacterium]